MTTIVWDGSELVTDSQLTHVEIVMFGGATVLSRIVDKQMAQKIFLPKNTTFKGQKIRAAAIAGSSSIFYHLQRLTSTGEKVELSDEALFAEFVKNEKEFVLLVVGDLFVATIQHLLGSVKVLDVTVYDKNTNGKLIAIGSGSHRVYQACGHTDGRVAVSYASFFDSYTGGNLCVWKDGAEEVKTVTMQNKYKSYVAVMRRLFRQWVMDNVSVHF